MNEIIRKGQLLINKDAYEELMYVYDKNLELQSVTGLTLDDIINKFSHGYRFIKVIDDAREDA